jgi:hypothetical protein
MFFMAVIDLPGGRKVITYPSPPRGFNPLNESDESLAKYGFPTRQSGNPAMMSQWTKRFGQEMTYVEAKFELVDGHRERPTFSPTMGTAAISRPWSGHYVQSDLGPGREIFALVSAEWTVPHPQPLTMDGTWYICLSWVGIDGFGSDQADVVQAGIESDIRVVNGVTEIKCYPWMQWFPSRQKMIMNLNVSFGDRVGVLVQADAQVPSDPLGDPRIPPKAYLSAIGSISNYTTGQTSMFRMVSPGPLLLGYTAEWIVERSGDPPTYSRLANYKSVQFTNAQAMVATDSNGDLTRIYFAGSGSDINMVDNDGTTVISTGKAGPRGVVTCNFV